jgi:diacylglycerol kinase family enzyme
LNPFGGSKDAKEIYQTVVKEMFEKANIETLYYETTSSDHISDITASLDLNNVDGIVGIGGDGLINQIVNGLYSRADIDSIKTIPIGHIPAGSQNALVISINGKKSIQEYVFSIIIGVTRKLDLIEVFFPEYNRRVYSLITVAYGFLGDVLEDSELFRWMGPFRYQFCAVKHFFKNKGYRATIAYLPSNMENQTDNSSWITLEDVELNMACAFNISGQSTQNPEMVPAQCDDGFITMLLVKKFSQISTLEYVINVFTESHLLLDSVQLIKTKSVKFIPDLSNASPINIDGELQPTSTMLLNAKEKCASFYYIPH